VVGKPRIFSTEMSFHAKPRPIVKLLLNIIFYRSWLKAERITSKINTIISFMLRNKELIAKISERILFVQFLSKFQTVYVLHFLLHLAAII